MHQLFLDAAFSLLHALDLFLAMLEHVHLVLELVTQKY